MKGIPRLVPIEKPVEGMQVVAFDNKIAIVDSILDKHYCTLKPDNICSLAYLSELQQIVIQYQQLSGNFNSAGQLLLHSEDWEKALPLIGKEVEFNIQRKGDISEWAELILPKQEESWQDVFASVEKYNKAWHKAIEPLLFWLDQNFHPPKLKQ